jgi:hypothetical protein
MLYTLALARRLVERDTHVDLNAPGRAPRFVLMTNDEIDMFLKPLGARLLAYGGSVPWRSRVKLKHRLKRILKEHVHNVQSDRATVLEVARLYDMIGDDVAVIALPQ